MGLNISEKTGANFTSKTTPKFGENSSMINYDVLGDKKNCGSKKVDTLVLGNWIGANTELKTMLKKAKNGNDGQHF